MRKLLFLTLIFLLAACGSAPTQQPSIPSLPLTTELPPFTTQVETGLPPAPLFTPTPPQPEATPTPRSTATLPGPPPTETLLPLLELPTERPREPAFEIWRGLPTYPADSEPGLSFRVDYDPRLWAETEDHFGEIVLAHREIPYCIIATWSGRGLPAGLKVEGEFRAIGKVNYEINTITRQDELEFVTYIGSSQNILTGFQVSFEEQKERCLEDAEAVLATLLSSPVKP